MLKLGRFAEGLGLGLGPIGNDSVWGGPTETPQFRVSQEKGMPRKNQCGRSQEAIHLLPKVGVALTVRMGVLEAGPYRNGCMCVGSASFGS